MNIVTITGVPDDIVDGDVTFTIEIGTASGGGYDGVNADDLTW